ncbi:glycosyltransferase family 2 protein [Actinoalloteichus caeruleus]|uniref:glycosyltransferase family 2 protein n=1 Tax=Actinoalloteichus cyanogriseus TaxID=2893586 RepID=UPI003AAA88C2
MSDPNRRAPVEFPRLAKDLLRRLVGRHVVAERWYRLRYAATRRAARAEEDAEVERLSTVVAPVPEATVVVVIPTYRRPGRLLAAVRSALGQTVRDVAVLVVDDGGGEVGTLPPDPRLRLIRLGRNHGSCGLARNVGIRLSRSPFVAFLDDDNTWRPDHLERALRALREEPGPGLAYTAVRRLRADGSQLDIIGREFDRRAHTDDSWADSNSIVVTRSPLVRFDPWARPRSVNPKEDWELVHRLSRRMRVTYVPVVTVDYAVHRGSYFTDWGERSGAGAWNGTGPGARPPAAAPLALPAGREGAGPPRPARAPEAGPGRAGSPEARTGPVDDGREDPRVVPRPGGVPWSPPSGPMRRPVAPPVRVEEGTAPPELTGRCGVPEGGWPEEWFAGPGQGGRSPAGGAPPAPGAPVPGAPGDGRRPPLPGEPG